MKLLLTIILLAGLAKAGGTTTAAPAYQVPSCHGIAQVPGYEKCHG